jgi:protease-4
VDRIGYMEDAFAEARRRANLPEESKVIVYRRTEYPDDNIYNPNTSYEGDRPAVMFDTGLSRLIPALPSGFYYLWHPASD